MKKSDLKSGMKLVDDNGWEWIVFLNCEYFYLDKKRTGDILLSNRPFAWNKLDSYDNDLTEIDEIYIPDHPYAINQFFGVKHDNNKNYDWKLIYDRNNDERANFLKAQLLEHEIAIEKIKNELRILE